MSIVIRFAVSRFARLNARFRRLRLAKDRIPAAVVCIEPPSLCSTGAARAEVIGSARVAAPVLNAGTFFNHRVHSKPQPQHKEVNMFCMLASMGSPGASIVKLGLRAAQMRRAWRRSGLKPILFRYIEM